MPNKKSRYFDSLRDFPSVEILGNHEVLAPYVDRLTRPLVVEVIKSVIAELKEDFRSGQEKIGEKELLKALKTELDRLAMLDLVPVINGSGIIIHTNLGRAPISRDMFYRAADMVTGYSNLEFNLATGKRGKRGILVEKLLATLCGTESATIVNNNAAALFIILNTLANRKEVIISRGELVQIGGGFRIPDIMTRSGVKLVEVGTTNRTSPADYEAAITDRTRMILKVHRSNFTQEGFVEECSLAELTSLCRKHDLVMVHDLGSGLISLPPEVDITGEPDVLQSVRAGADLTCFSGDKLLGGVQSGLIAGRSDLVAKIKKNPLFRVLRCDKLVFSLATQVFASYLRGDQYRDIPVWNMITIPLAQIKVRGEAMKKACPGKDIVLVATPCYLGGGSTPGQTIPSLSLSMRGRISPTMLAKRFRAHDPPIIGRVEKDDFLLDLRTIPFGKEEVIIAAINEILS